MQQTKKIQDWLITHIAELLQVSPDTINIRETFSNYGLSSLDVVTLSGELEEFLGRRLSPTLAYDYPNILTLSRFLAETSESKKSSPLTDSITSTSNEPIAVIGVGCRFPGAKDPESFWQILRDGIDTISEIPSDRWNKQAFYHPDAAVPGKSISYWGGFLDRVDTFDPFFFGISPIEAKHMDPQQRLLLELSYEALDDAGQIKENLAGSKTGVFMGISLNEYSQLQFSDPSMITSHSGTGSALSIAANRISYFFNFHGPSMAIDTACSSSLTAVHLACQSIRNGECEMALAGGVNIILSPAHSIAFTKAGVLAPDGRCKTFDSLANGYVRGEGGGVIILKPLSTAMSDGDPIHALILGSAIHQDGRTNGLMAPSSEEQEILLRKAYQAAGILPGSVKYVEAHGTGTLLGDSMEAKALGKVVGADRKNGPCAVGSVKTNIGHLEAAAGIAGLIKVILSLKHRTIPPSLHYSSPNPHISFDDLNLCVNDKLNPFASDSDPLLAGVSSFGFGGTNVHMIVSEAVNNKPAEEPIKPVLPTSSNFHLLPLSAKSPEALLSQAGNFLELLTSDSSIAANDLCYTVSAKRSHYDYRLAVIGNSKEDLYSNLQAFINKEQRPDLFVGRKALHRQPKLAFVFSGQGGQWHGMCRELLKQEPVFHKAIKRIDHIIKEQFSWSLIDELNSQSVSRLDEIDVVQPALFAIQVALAELWQSWGIKPDAVVGHSMGEVASAYIAGILSLEDAIKIVCCRSQLLKQLSGKGSMMVTELSRDQAKEILDGYDNDIAIAVINSPSSTVLSGNPETIDKIKVSLDRQNLFCKLVNVDVASHSPQIDYLRMDMYKVLEGLDPQRPGLTIYSTVTGAKANDVSFNADYWIDNLRKPVLFSDAIGQLLDDGYSIFVEIGPHPVLLSSIQQSVKPYHEEVRLLPSIRRDEPEHKVLLGSLGRLYTEGFSIDWKKLYPVGGKNINLPLIPWQRQRYWIETKSSGSKDLWHPGKNNHPLLGERMNLANSPSTFVWQIVFDDEMLNFLEDHRIENDIVFPAAGYIEMALQSAKETSLHHTHELSDFVIKESMILQPGKPGSVQVILSPEEDGNYVLNVYSRINEEADWILHASVNFIQEQAADNLVALAGTSPDIIRQHSTSQFTSEEFYQTLQLRGIKYGPGFQVLQHIWSKDDESLGLISLPESLQYDSKVYQIHPALLDGCLQVVAATQSTSVEHNLYIPTGCKRIRFFSQPNGLITSHVILRSDHGSAKDVLYADIKLSGSNGQPVAELIGFSLQRTSRRIRNLLSLQDTWLYHLQWQIQKQRDITSPVFHREKHWLIFADDQGYAEELAKQLEAIGDHCHLLFFKDIFKNPEDFREDSFSEVIEKSLKDISSSLYGIIHLWSLSTPPLSIDKSVTADVMQMPGCNSVLYLAKSLAKRIARMPVLWLVTKGAQSVSNEPIAVEQSAVWGLGKVISFELPELKCIRVDLDRGQSVEETTQDLIKQILIDDREDQIAFRAGRRFVLRLLPYTFKTSNQAESFSLKPGSTYLITGGLGALGIRTAKWMVQKGAQHLVLLGRSEPSPLVMSMIEQMRHEGIEVFIAQADVSDIDQLRNVVDKIKDNMPVLQGVIHAAGVLDDGSILNLNSERMKKVMAPKVDGTWNLHNATSGFPLDFFVLFSSAVSVLGSPGQGNYAVASTYLDAMAHYRHNLGLPAMSINWGPWAEVGLAAETIERLKEANSLNQHLIKVIKIDEGLEILEQLLMESDPQVMVLPFDLKNLIELYPTAAGMPFLSEVGGNETHVARLYARPNLRQDYVAPRNEIELKLAELWRHTLHIDRVGVHDSFFELGGDSVLAAQILSLAQKNFGIRINPQDAFKAFTIERLAGMLEAEMLSKLGKMSEDEARQLLAK